MATAITLVVDACQARITSPAIADYLERGAIVFVTGSKFMGGPPFSGFALVPRRFREESLPLAQGLATIFRRGEWPLVWPGAEALEDGANPGLLLRLEASIFELERFQRLSLEQVERVILCFHQAVREEIIEKSPAHRVAPYPPGEKETADTHPIEMRTLSTLDLSEYAGGATFEDSVRWHKAMLADDVRLGQPVKCVKLDDGNWGATLAHRPVDADGGRALGAGRRGAEALVRRGYDENPRGFAGGGGLTRHPGGSRDLRARSLGGSRRGPGFRRDDEFTSRARKISPVPPAPRATSCRDNSRPWLRSAFPPPG